MLWISSWSYAVSDLPVVHFIMHFLPSTRSRGWDTCIFYLFKSNLQKQLYELITWVLCYVMILTILHSLNDAYFSFILKFSEVESLSHFLSIAFWSSGIDGLACLSVCSTVSDTRVIHTCTVNWYQIFSVNGWLLWSISQTLLHLKIVLEKIQIWH